MFRLNDAHLQGSLFSALDELPPKLRAALDSSWAGVFYREVFCRLDESLFADLYADSGSRPNTPVNVLLGFEIIKAGFGWSDSATHERFTYDLQVRYAVGCRTFSQGHFELRTVYNFRKRLREYCELTGRDLMTLAFERVTDDQLRALALDTGQVRVDSTQVASNIRDFSRLQFLVEVLIRVRRMLSLADRRRYGLLLDSYVTKSSTKFVFNVSSAQGRVHVAKIGRIMAKLVDELAQDYGQHETYALLKRVFEEQFIQDDEDGWRPRKHKEFGSPLVCSPDDQEASTRRKRGIVHKGYVVNVTETCAVGNPMQLIVKVQTAPNIKTDVDFLKEAVISLKRRLDIDTCYTDGGYNQEALYRMMSPLGIEHLQTGIQGHPSMTRLGLYQYQISRAPTGEPLTLICPNGQHTSIHSHRPGRYHASFDHDQCRGCPHIDRCRSNRNSLHRTVYFTDYDMEIARRRLYIESIKDQASNPRSAVESTVYSVKRPFGDKLPVRGRFRVHTLMIGSALMANVRRIMRAMKRIAGPDGQVPASARLQKASFSVLRKLAAHISQILNLRLGMSPG